MPNLQSYMVGKVEPNQQGELQGGLTSLMSLTTIIGPIMMTSVFYYFTTDRAPFVFPGAAFLLGGIMMCVSFIITWYILLSKSGKIKTNLYNNSDNYLYKALTVGADLFLSSNTLYYPVIEKIDTNGNSVGSLEIFSHLGGLTPDLGIDTINNKIILLTANYSLGGIPFIFRCDLTAFIASSCTEHDISSGMPSSTYFPKLNIDLVNQKLLVLAYNGDILYLYHCNLDATNCKVTPISGTKSILTSSD